MPQRAAFWLGLSVWRNQGTLHQSLRGGAFGRGRALKALQLCSLRFHPHALHQCSWLKEFTNAAGGKWRLKPDAATTTFSHEDSKLPQENEWKSLSDCKRRKILDTVQLDAKRCAHCPDPGGSRQSVSVSVWIAVTLRWLRLINTGLFVSLWAPRSFQLFHYPSCIATMAYECENIFQYFEIFDIILKSDFNFWCWCYCNSEVAIIKCKSLINYSDSDHSDPDWCSFLL